MFSLHHQERETKSSNLKVGKFKIGPQITGFYSLHLLYPNNLNSMDSGWDDKENLQDQDGCTPRIKSVISKSKSSSKN
jgi:hypothetical protein